MSNNQPGRYIGLYDERGWHGSASRIKILVRDFIADDVGRPAMIDDTTTDERFIESFSTAPLYASVPIPTGYAAYEVMIYGSATSAIVVYEAAIDKKDVSSLATGNIGTLITGFTKPSSPTNYLLIQLAQASGEEVYGGYVSITNEQV
jgi:hypothetical protein